MTEHVQIVSSGVSLSDAMRAAIVSQASRLERSVGQLHGLHGCHVNVNCPATGGSSRMYNVGIRLTVDDKDLVSNQHEHPDFYVALRHACEAMQRQLRTYRGVCAAAVLPDKPAAAHHDQP